MAIDFRSVPINFDPTSGQTQSQSATAVFGSTVRRADAALKGYTIGFDNGEHPLLQQEVSIVSTSINDNTVTVTVDFLVRDGSGDIDDPFSGSVAVLVLADVA
jgi:hypothetical protein